MRTWVIAGAMLLAACGHRMGSSNDGQTLAQARAAHHEVLPRQVSSDDPVPTPPPGMLDIIHFPTPLGAMVGYLTPPPTDGGKHPAIIWISGGNLAIGDFWSPAPRENDQSARAFREAGIIEMYPSQRGNNGNPGSHEGFYGEVDDIRAAADWLARQPGVDPQRIYLGGHSTGATLAMLVAESDPRFRGTFVFGPVTSVDSYGDDILPFPLTDATEIKLRAPGEWLGSIKSPLFAFEGDHHGNTDELQRFQSANDNPQAHFSIIPRADHFSTLAPATELIARKIVADTGPKTNIAFSQAELDGLVK
jgi:dienelactone hydrolase